MSDGQADTNMKPAEFVRSEEARKASASGSLEARLMAARAKRALALAERGEASNKTDTSNNQEATEAAQAEAPEQQPADIPEEIRGSKTSPLVARAAFVFAGAAGFGLGSVMAVGIMASFWTVPVLPTPETQAVSIAPAEVLQASLLPAQARDATIDADQTNSDGAKAAETKPAQAYMAQTSEEMPRLVGMIDKDIHSDIPRATATDLPAPTADMYATAQFVPAIVRDEQPAFPEISKVAYMRLDTKAEEAMQLRSLPTVPDTTEPVLFGKPPQVFLHAPESIPYYSVQALLSELEQSGIEIAKVGRENFRVSSTHLRYYSPTTAEYAMTVANRLGVEARDFSQNATSDVRIELWIAGGPKVEEETVEISVRADSAKRARDLRENR